MHFQLMCWFLVIVMFATSIFLSSAAEIGHHKMRHHGRSNHQHAAPHAAAVVKSDDLPSADSKVQTQRTLPPNIWGLLAANSLMSRRNQTTNDDGSKYSGNNDDDETARNEIDIDVDFDRHSDADESIKKVSANCPKCKQNSVKMSEDELTSLRIEYVKNQILHKLRMNERPPPKDMDELPEPIQEGYAIQNDDDTDYLNRHLDDYYAKTTQKIIFLTEG